MDSITLWEAFCHYCRAALPYLWQAARAVASAAPWWREWQRAGRRTMTAHAQGREQVAELIDAKELARRLGLKPRVVMIMSRRGRIPRVEISPHVIRFVWADVLRTLGL